MARSPHNARRVLARLGLALLAALVTLFALEGALRLAALAGRGLRGGARGRVTILCVGDSHTYGLHVLPPLSYPAQLQALLDPSGRETGVLNYGVPGRNSSVLLRELPRYLEETAPRAVLVEVGFNDTWNFDGAAEAEDGPGSRALFASSRLLRMVRLLLLGQRGREPAPPDVIERDGKLVVVEDGRERPAGVGGAAFGLVEGEALKERVAANLTEMVRLVRASGAAPVLLTYASENQQVFRELNARTRELAARLDVALVELDALFREEIAARGYAALFFPDDHPRAPGNELIARAARDCLLAQGLVSPPASAAAAAEEPAPRLAISGQDREAVTFALSGAPERDFQIVLSPVSAPPIEFLGRTIPLGEHPLIARCLESQDLRGRTDSAGRARVRLSLGFLAAHAGQEVHAIAAVFPVAITPETPPALSNVVSLRP
ncbi:MAG: hypothetical protein HY812_11615 [Planctomycetes bacterium]|nr:hypothetical protein [Planctomycetota bacterium]